MAGKFGSASVFLLVDGYNLISTKLQTLRCKIEALTTRADGLGDGNYSHDPTGLTKVELEQGGAYFDTSATGGHAALAASVPTSPQATARTICLGFEGQVMGAGFLGLSAAFSTAYELLVKVGDLSKANVTYLVSGVRERGQIVQPLATKTGDWNTKALSASIDYTLTPQRAIPITSNTQAATTVVTTTVPHGLTSGQVVLISGVATSSPTINGQRTVTVLSTTTFSVPVDTSAGAAGTGGSFVLASTVNGGSGYQQVTALSGFTGFIGKIQHSPDDTTYADLVTFANVTAAPASERKTAAGTVDRYLCFDGDVTGAGSITTFAGFARG